MQHLTDNQLKYHFHRVAHHGADNPEQQELIAEAMLLSRAMNIDFFNIVQEPSFKQEFAKTVRLRRVK